MGDTPSLILVSGLPASGKSSLAEHLSDELHVPMFSKDALKERMFDTIGWSDREWSKKMGMASSELLWLIAEQSLRAGKSLLLESNFDKRFTDPALAALKARHSMRVIEVHCVAERDVLIERYGERAASGNRHPGHMESDKVVMTAELLPRIRNAVDEPLDNADVTINVDTTDYDRVSLPLIVEQVRRQMAG